MKLLYLSILLILLPVILSAQIKGLEARIEGVWVQCRTYAGDKKQKFKGIPDIIYFFSDKTYRWIHSKDSVDTGTWKKDKRIKGIRLTKNLTKAETAFYESFGVKEENLGRIDLAGLIVSKDTFSFITNSELEGEVRKEYIRRR